MNFSPCCEAVCELICGVGRVASASASACGYGETCYQISPERLRGGGHWPGRPAPRSRRRPPCIRASLREKVHNTLSWASRDAAL